jgi:hypothetical protein
MGVNTVICFCLKNHFELCQNQRNEEVKPEVLTAVLMKINLMGYDTASTVINLADYMDHIPGEIHLEMI